MQDVSLAGIHARLMLDPAVAAFALRVSGALPGEAIGPVWIPEAVQPAVVAAALQAASGRNVPVLWLTVEPDEARTLAEMLRTYVRRSDRVLLFPAPDPMPHERIAWDPATREARMTALAALWRWRAEGQKPMAPWIVAPLRGAMTCTLPFGAYSDAVRLVRKDERVPITALIGQLERLGYERVSQVSEPGHMAQRGGIVDFFAPALPDPVRLEWFDDEIESLRAFDPNTQRSLYALEACAITPASELLPSFGPRIAEQVGSQDDTNMHPLAQMEWRRHREHLAAGERFAGIELFASLLHPERTSLLDHFPPDGLLVLDDPERLEIAAEHLHAQAAVVFREQVEAGELPSDWSAQPLADWSQLAESFRTHARIELGQDSSALAFDTKAVTQGAPSIASAFGTPARFGGRVEEMVLDAMALMEQGEAVVVVSRQAPRIAELFGEAGMSVQALPALARAPGPGGLAVIHGALGAGWTQRAEGEAPALTVWSDGEIFGWRMPHRRRKARERSAVSNDEFSELHDGDFVVHIEHGIGLFRGLHRMAVGDVERDYLHLEYASGDVLYVPTHQADRVARYVGAGDVSPSVTRLGTADWERAKAKAKREVEDIAEDLLALYARRETSRRAAFASDTPWQAEMEASFPYVETDDQLRAIEAVKADMESPRPMDRLVVGDVGFGKTEVALRAAFKAVMDGRQVAVLAPTTVLAQQHYETFRQRMAAFPVKVDVLSRFRKKKDQQAVLDALQRGEVDVLIGTHRLLSGDVVFSRLGLLIVDEEHRFGVKHKETLRQMAEGVDTLTLTATPIPRTMHLALTGLRDLTKIDTPPSERLPVVTHVGPYDETLIRQAIRREIGRRGQTFFVSHRVRGIAMIEQRVRRLVPEARTAIAHGQLAEAELATAMLSFVSGQVDVLICTSIIESGLDIPNANTLIVERADRFGLAQLHQLRGRVGRSAQRAYAYLLHPAGWDLQPEARRRLLALAEHDDLGAGFRLAMRDLEIRGAGEILGARQHGQVAAIGLDLYTKLLAEAIKKVRADRDRDSGEPSAVSETVQRELESIDPGTLPTVDLPLDAFLPETYVSETRERTRLYRRMASAHTLDQVDEIETELLDRFGPAPRPVLNLLQVLRLRVLAHMAGALSIALEGDVVAVRWGEDNPIHRTALKKALDPTARIGRHRVGLPVQRNQKPEAWLTMCTELLNAIVMIEQVTPSED